jgi:hypothetical protein
VQGHSKLAPTGWLLAGRTPRSCMLALLRRRSLSLPDTSPDAGRILFWANALPHSSARSRTALAMMAAQSQGWPGVLVTQRWSNLASNCINSTLNRLMWKLRVLCGATGPGARGRSPARGRVQDSPSKNGAKRCRASIFNEGTLKKPRGRFAASQPDGSRMAVGAISCRQALGAPASPAAHP